MLFRSQSLDVNSTIEPVYEKSTEGTAIYRRTLCFILATVAQKLFPNNRLLVGHSVGYGYYYTMETEKGENVSISIEIIESLKKGIQTLIVEDKSIL